MPFFQLFLSVFQVRFSVTARKIEFVPERSHCRYQDTAITSIIFVFAINIIVFYLYDALSLSYEQRIKNELINQEREFYYNQCEIMHTTSKEIAGLQHDMKNHFFALHELIDGGEYSKAKDYILELTEKSSGQTIICDTGNIVIDSIINYKFRNKETVNSTCVFYAHQAKLPANAKKLRKF